MKNERNKIQAKSQPGIKVTTSAGKIKPVCHHRYLIKIKEELKWI